jgi:single-strand DNA-binding protein
MNTVILMGRLTRDPEIRYSQGDSQNAVARFSIAVDRRFRRDGGQEADFVDCSACGRSAEFVEKYLKKGVKIVLQGRIENNNYTNREGQKVYGTRIVAEKLEPCDRRAESADAPAPAATDDGPITEAPEEDFFPDEDMPDLPFA